jgi:hypothetical protein
LFLHNQSNQGDLQWTIVLKIRLITQSKSKENCS